MKTLVFSVARRSENSDMNGLSAVVVHEERFSHGIVNREWNACKNWLSIRNEVAMECEV